jgi:chemotaxis protein methyltransferase CheR
MPTVPMVASPPGLDDVARFRAAIARHLGLHLDESKQSFLAEVLQRRVDASAMTSAGYLDRIDGAAARDELRALARELTVGETYFFRHREQLQAFAEVALPERWAARAAGQPLRILSAGCASGDEPYTLAILSRERILGAETNVSIRAVDVNAVALDRAVRGRYTAWSLRETPPEAQRRWFTADGREFILDPSVRALVTFDERNLTDGGSDLWLANRYDVIFCRNVMMYFTTDEAQALVNRLTAALTPGGYLFLGHAETLRGLSQDFHLCHTHETFYYQRKDGASAASAPDGFDDALPWQANARSAPPPSSPPAPTGDTAWIGAVSDASQRIKALAERPRIDEGGQRTPSPARNGAALATALELLKRERFNEALQLLDNAAPETSADADGLLLRAVLLTHSGQIAAAETVCARLLALDELSTGAHYILAQCREAAGDRRGAQEHDQAAVYLDPTFAMPRLHLGLMARRLGDRDTAQRELEQAARLLPREDASRLLLFGGGFTRESLLSLCHAEWLSAGGRP